MTAIIGREFQCRVLHLHVEQSNQFIHAYKANPNMTLGKETPSTDWSVPSIKMV
jgi:hypothetical protein